MKTALWVADVESGADPRSAADPRIGLYACRRADFIARERDQRIARGPGVRPTIGSPMKLSRVFQLTLTTRVAATNVFESVDVPVTTKLSGAGSRPAPRQSVWQCLRDH
jgi:hypothetical protein